MRIAIVEDEQREQARLAAYIRQYFEERQKTCQITLFSDGDEILEDYAASWDLVFLDIQMERMDGMTTAEKIRRLDQNVILVFVTNLAFYAIRGYAVRALDFLLKPVNSRMLTRLLEQAEQLLCERGRKSLTLPTERGMIRVSLSDIYYIEVNNHMLSAVTKQGIYRMRGTISAVEDTLRDSGFYRCNNCYLINLSQVNRVEPGMAVVGDHTLTVSRPRQKGFMAALTRYIGGAGSYG